MDSDNLAVMTRGERQLSEAPEPCVLCTIRPADSREHVWPSWYLKIQDQKGPGPFAWTRNGKPIVDRRGNPIGPGEHRMRVLLDICASCNHLLEKRFETPAKEVLKRLFAADGQVVLTAEEARLAGLWFAKTWLLLFHPEARYANTRVNDEAVRFASTEMPPAEFYSWLTENSPPPEGLSIWAHRAGVASRERAKYVVPVPRVTTEGRTIQFVEGHIGLHGLTVTLVIHPGWPLEHPLERDGRAVRLLPSTGEADVDLTELPLLWPHIINWRGCSLELKPHLLGSKNLPPLRAADTSIPVLPEIEPLLAGPWSF